MFLPRGVPKVFQPVKGFSLVEVLVTLAIMGVIMTFAIPPLFMNSSTSLSTKYTNRASDAAFMIRNAYQQYKLTHATVATTMTIDSLIPYMTYSKIDTTSHLDDHVGASVDIDCSNSNTGCLKLYDGSSLGWYKDESFGGSASTNGIYFYFDPNGTRDTSGTADVPGKTLCLFLTYKGNIYTRATPPAPGIWTSYGGPNTGGAYDPAWFTGF